MALVSPGVEITVIDESNYVPNASGTVPFIVIATAENKTNGAGTGIAPGTTSANAGNTYLVGSQRELSAVFGTPNFYQNTAGSMIHGYELNEYGLFAAYSLLGVSNRAYVQRADIDLGQLVGTSSVPTGSVSDNTLWLDTASTGWGIFEWSSATQSFTAKTPLVITSTDNLTGGVPKTNIGSIGDYAVVATNTSNPTYYKNYNNTWVLVGSAPWKISHATIQGTATSPTLTAGNTLLINGTTITASGTTLTSLVSDINTAAITGVTARLIDNKLALDAADTASSDGSTADGSIQIANGLVGTILADLGITTGTYANPAVQQSAHTSIPEWKTTDNTSRPTGSIWVKTTTPNLGANFDVYIFDTADSSWTAQSAPLYENDQTALKNLDSVGGGANLTSGYYVQFDVSENDTVTYKLFQRATASSTVVTGSEENPTLTSSEEFTISASTTNSTTLTTPVTVTLSGTTAADMVADIQSANVTNVSASLTASNQVVITHTTGGVIVLKDTSGTPLNDAGITTSLDNVRAGNDSDLIASNWIPATYTASATQPTSDPANGTSWYYSVIDEVDIMIHDGTDWKGYQNVTSDARGFNLGNTDPNGPIVSATEPTTQTDGTSLVVGDIWVDSSDLENYPKIYRYQTVDSVNQFVLIDNTDQTTENGILFADARWSTDGSVDVITGTRSTIKNLLTSDYVDLDAPDSSAYPRGMLLFNLRRSGYNVKQLVKNKFTRTNYPNASSFPAEADTWQTVSGLKQDGSPYMGRQAVRNVVVTAMKAAIDSNTDIREEQRVFNVIATPGYPELMPNMISLNNERRNTAFIIGDAPLRISPEQVESWSSGSNGSVTDETNLATNDPYLGVFYPSGLANDLNGNSVVVPPSHMMLRTFALSDDRSFPWFAPAGNRRGLIDNVNSIGYINSTTGEFVELGVRESLRDTLYTNSVNPITFIPGTGLCNYGNKTRAGLPSALDRINVARLVGYIRENLASISKSFIFEPNDKITRDELGSAIAQFMNDLVAKRGLYDYLVVCDETNNTTDRIDRNELYVDIAIEPVKSVEFIYIPIRLKNTGEITGNNVANSNAV